MSFSDILHGRVATAASEGRLFSKTATGEFYEYTDADATDAVVVSNSARTTAQIAAGLNQIDFQTISEGQIFWISAAEAIEKGAAVKCAANGQIQNVDVNATPVQQNRLGFALTNSTTANDLVKVKISTAYTVES